MCSGIQRIVYTIVFMNVVWGTSRIRVGISDENKCIQYSNYFVKNQMVILDTLQKKEHEQNLCMLQSISTLSYPTKAYPEWDPTHY